MLFKPRVFAGVAYYTGEYGIADTDKDGIPDPLDKCLDKKDSSNYDLTGQN